jgi:hypothetical protein
MIYNSSEPAKARATITDTANNILESSRDTSSLFAPIKSGGVESSQAGSDSDVLQARIIQNKMKKGLTTKGCATAIVGIGEKEKARIGDELMPARIEEEKLILDSLETSGTFQSQIGLRHSPRRVPLNIPSIQLNDELIGDFIWGSFEIEQTLKWQEKESPHIKPKKTENSKKRTNPLHREKHVCTNDDETFSLYTDIDKLHLNDVHILIRRDILEGYVVSVNPVDRNSRRNRQIQKYANTVGFRCKWCKHISLNDRSELASVYPRTVRCVYNSVVRFQRHHIM